MCPLAAGGGFSARLIAAEPLEEEIAGRGVGVGRCLTCASCEARCPQGVRFTDYVRGLRELLPPEARLAPPHGGVFQAVARSMAEGEPVRRPAWLGDDLEVADRGEVALFVGCAPFFDLFFEEDLGVRTLDIARAAVRLLNRAGLRPVIVPSERCCGHDLLWAGDRQGFAALARANCEAFASRGVRRILTACAECCRTWRIDYAEAVPEYHPRVEHLAEFLAAEVQAGKMRFRKDGPALLTFQDPCRLGRHLGVTGAPREVLASIAGERVVEMRRNGRDAVCCGTSGFIHCDAESRRLQAERLAEAEDTGAGVLVTACPKCLIHFTCARAEDRRRGAEVSKLEIQDLTVLAARMLDDAGAKAGPGAVRQEGATP
jgi:Fe-S oxidoreductase